MMKGACSSGVRRPRSGPYMTTRQAETALGAEVGNGAGTGPGRAVWSIFEIDSGGTRADYSVLARKGSGVRKARPITLREVAADLDVS